MQEDLVLCHERGMQFLTSRKDILSGLGKSDATWSELATIGQDSAARKLRDHLAIHLGIDARDYLDDVQFAAAVELIAENCGPDTRQLLFNGKFTQSRDGILKLSRTADTRQRYRVDGVRKGQFRSVAPQDDDPVFDTVKFGEVPSRLRRARGWIQLLRRNLKGVRGAIRQECRRLVELCRESACALQRFLETDPGGILTIPSHLDKQVVLPSMKIGEIRGQAVHDARLSLRFTIKSVWDFPEMRKRGIVPNEIERERTIQETDKIIAIADRVLRR